MDLHRWSTCLYYLMHETLNEATGSTSTVINVDICLTLLTGAGRCVFIQVLYANYDISS